MYTSVELWLLNLEVFYRNCIVALLMCNISKCFIMPCYQACLVCVNFSGTLQNFSSFQISWCFSLHIFLICVIFLCSTFLYLYCIFFSLYIIFHVYCRFSSPDSINQLPGWVKPYVNKCQNFGKTLKDIAVFFKTAEQMVTMICDKSKFITFWVLIFISKFIFCVDLSSFM
jgi:hypothetical protein